MDSLRCGHGTDDHVLVADDHRQRSVVTQVRILLADLVEQILQLIVLGEGLESGPGPRFRSRCGTRPMCSNRSEPIHPLDAAGRLSAGCGLCGQAR